MLVTIGAVVFGTRPGYRVEVKQPAETRAPLAPAAARGIPVKKDEASSAPPGDAKREIRALPKWPADRPFELIREIAGAAYAGDSDAQYRIAKELDRCEMTLGLVRKSIDPEEALWNLPEVWTPAMKERAFAEYQRCARLLREDPFSALPPRAGGYPMGYWLTRAVESGQPVALAERAVTQLILEVGDSDDAGTRRAQAREMLVTAILSGNPDAPLMMGFLMRGAQGTERQLQGAAWMLAACRAGAECGSDSAMVPMWMCYDIRCQPGVDVETMLQTALSAEELTQVHARYERIAAALRDRDAEAISAQLGFPAP